MLQGVGGNQADNSSLSTGAVYVYIRSGGIWSFQEYIKASNAGSGDVFGSSLAISADGNTLVVGAESEDSNATGVGGNQADNSSPSTGAAYIYTRSGSTWSFQEYIKASNAENGDLFGSSLSLSADGNTLVVGAKLENSNAIGFDGDDTDNSFTDSGAAYKYTRSGSTWSFANYIKASNTVAPGQTHTLLKFVI